MIQTFQRDRYHDVNDELVNDVADEVVKRILDRFYPAPTWYQASDGSIYSDAEDLAAMDVAALRELRWRILFRHRLDPKAGLGRRLEYVDRWIQDELQRESKSNAAAAQGLQWGGR